MRKVMVGHRYRVVRIVWPRKLPLGEEISQGN